MTNPDRPHEARLDAQRCAIMDAGFPEIEWPTFSSLIVALPWLTALVGLLPVALFASGIAWLERDPSVDAFVSHDHPAWQARELARETFGLEDPAIVVFAQEEGTSAFNAATLAAVDRFTDEVAYLAGTMAAKRTHELIPFCHPLGLESCKIAITLEEGSALIDCRVRVFHKTGVEMEALTGASVAALTVYDMCKALSHDIVITDLRLVAKTGGKSDYAAPAAD